MREEVIEVSKTIVSDCHYGYRTVTDRDDEHTECHSSELETVRDNPVEYTTWMYCFTHDLHYKLVSVSIEECAM
jgi:hypothetical protein